MQLHVCNELITGECKQGSRCTRNHNLRDKQSMRVFLHHDLYGLADKPKLVDILLMSIMTLPDTNSSTNTQIVDSTSGGFGVIPTETSRMPTPSRGASSRAPPGPPPTLSPRRQKPAIQEFPNITKAREDRCDIEKVRLPDIPATLQEQIAQFPASPSKEITDSWIQSMRGLYGPRLSPSSIGYSPAENLESFASGIALPPNPPLNAAMSTSTTDSSLAAIPTEPALLSYAGATPLVPSAPAPPSMPQLVAPPFSLSSRVCDRRRPRGKQLYLCERFIRGTCTDGKDCIYFHVVVRRSQREQFMPAKYFWQYLVPEEFTNGNEYSYVRNEIQHSSSTHDGWLDLYCPESDQIERSYCTTRSSHYLQLPISYATPE